MKPPAGRADSASPWRAPKTNGPRHAATGAAQHAERSLPGAIPVLVLRVTPIGHMPTANAQRAGVEGHTWKESRAGGARGCQIGDMGAARLWKAAQGQRFHGRPARSFASSACPFSWQHFFGGPTAVTEETPPTPRLWPNARGPHHLRTHCKISWSINSVPVGGARYAPVPKEEIRTSTSKRCFLRAI